MSVEAVKLKIKQLKDESDTLEHDLEELNVKLVEVKQTNDNLETEQMIMRNRVKLLQNSVATTRSRLDGKVSEHRRVSLKPEHATEMQKLIKHRTSLVESTEDDQGILDKINSSRQNESLTASQLETVNQRLNNTLHRLKTAEESLAAKESELLQLQREVSVDRGKLQMLNGLNLHLLNTEECDAAVQQMKDRIQQFHLKTEQSERNARNLDIVIKSKNVAIAELKDQREKVQVDMQKVLDQFSDLCLAK